MDIWHMDVFLHVNYKAHASSAVQWYSSLNTGACWNTIHSGLFSTSLFLSPAKGPSSETISGYRWVDEDNPFHQKVGHCKPLAVASGNTVRKRTWRRVNHRTWRRVNHRTWRRVNHNCEFYLELWHCTAVLFQFHLVSFPDHIPVSKLRGSGQLEQNLPFLWSENWTQSTCTLLSHHIAATWKGKGSSPHLPVPLRQLVRFISA